MPENATYLMESEEEVLRLDAKTDESTVEKQADWAGIRPGMRVADVGCGPGKTTAVLHRLVQPGGTAVGIDGSAERIAFAREQYGKNGLDFVVQDLRNPLEGCGRFDFIWVRFVLEYFRNESAAIVENLTGSLNPGGILCLIDLDHNCLNHYDMPVKLEETLRSFVKALQEQADFDPFAGRRLYSFLYDLGFQEIDVDVAGHHVIFGSLEQVDAFNWMKKVQVAPGKIDFDFSGYDGGHEQFARDFQEFFNDPRRFTYSPLICCRGRKPLP